MRSTLCIHATLVLCALSPAATAQDWSPDGRRLTFQAQVDGFPQVMCVDLDGTNLQQLTFGDAESRSPAWSPDGARIAMYHGHGDVPPLPTEQQRFDLVLIELAPDHGAPALQSLTDAGYNSRPRWSHDGRLAFSRRAPGDAGDIDLFVMDPADGEARIVLDSAGRDYSPAWAPDGERLVFVSDRDGGPQIYALDLSDGTVERLTEGLGFDVFPDWSPGGTRIVFSSARESAPGTYVMAADGSGVRLVISDVAVERELPERRAAQVEFPTTPEVFTDALGGSEGITFNGSGQLFIGGDNAVWRADPDGNLTRLTDVTFHLGQAGIGERDILAADFGPDVALNVGPNDDGVVWRITPEGDKSVVASGIGDPNAVLVLEDRSWLVSDDFTNHIYRVTPGSEVEIWSEAVEYPNGLALSLDGSTLYVAQIFTAIDPVEFDNRVWALPLENGRPAGPARLLAQVGTGGHDGLALDELGRVYVADNGGGSIWRVDPETGATVLIAEGMPHVASLVFGEGEFDHHALYATSTFRGGGTVWKVHVGVGGAPLYR